MAGLRFFYFFFFLAGACWFWLLHARVFVAAVSEYCVRVSQPHICGSSNIRVGKLGTEPSDGSGVVRGRRSGDPRGLLWDRGKSGGQCYLRAGRRRRERRSPALPRFLTHLVPQSQARFYMALPKTSED